ncbi:hypothetical protein RHSIM_Rhsim01G0072400 [Rhododendron simsii]|uniref:Uncharacterized protein n=1 Tax=Rhododendron simsii TaxID=118357 RepID=A0A834HNM4_RHOSS|nr:hypothetical protein RHSIM_Rhsim01G0072400 [Rhododendron simsii]
MLIGLITWGNLRRLGVLGAGLGFRDLRCFNLALLAKQWWQLLKGGRCLLHRILKAKYFPKCSFLRQRAGYGKEWVRIHLGLGGSILEGGKIINVDLRWRIGTRDRVVIDRDQWLPKYEPMAPASVKEEGRGRKVQFLIDPHTLGSKEDLVKEVFSAEESQLILSIPLLKYPVDDKIIWHFSTYGNYTVKSGYESAMMLQINECLGRRAVGEHVHYLHIDVRTCIFEGGKGLF